MKISNAFSINMLADLTKAYTLTITPTDAQNVRNFPLESFIGHVDTATLVAKDLGSPLEYFVSCAKERKSMKVLGDEAFFVAQYVGPRLTEGTTVLPDGAVIQYFCIQVYDGNVPASHV